jgi:hypothetical protein
MSKRLVRLIVISDFVSPCTITYSRRISRLTFSRLPLSQACPWCFVAHRELQNAIAQCSNLPISFEVEYRPFMLHNTSPSEPVDKNEFIGRKIGRERWEACKVMATERGEAVGINL